MRGNPLTSVDYIRELMNRHGFSPSKGLGQNFLINEGVLGRIADAADIDADTLAIEIGPGIGSLSYELCRRAKRVTAIELDRRLTPVLEETLSEFDNFELIVGDALKVDIARIIAANPCPRTVICANLPYYITTPIIMRLLENNLPVLSITVMVQKEVARRFCATPQKGDYGAITVSAGYYAYCKILFDVSPGSFLPPPKVTSSVVSFTPHKAPIVEPADRDLMFELIRAAFGQRRKTLANALSNHFSRLDKQAVIDAMAACGLAAEVRGEKLSLFDFARLSDYLGLAQNLSGQ